MVEQTPFMGDSGTFISGSKSSIVAKISTESGHATRLTGNNQNVDHKKCQNDTCHNITIAQNIIPKVDDSFLLVINTYKLNAVNLHSQQPVWSAMSSELLDVSDKEESFILSSEHRGYDLCLTEPNVLKATAGSWSKDEWEFKTSAPIIGVYQIIRGKRLAKLKLCTKSSIKKSQAHCFIYSHNSTIFAGDIIREKNAGNVGNSGCSFMKVTVQLVRAHKLLEINEEHIKPDAAIASRGLLSPITVLLGIFGIGTAIILILFLIIKQRLSKVAGTHEIAVGDEESSHSGRGLLLSEENEKLNSSKTSPEETSEDKIIKEKKISGSEVKVGHLSIYTDQTLGYGSLGTIVYKGKFEHRNVAIKRMLRPFHDVATKEISALIVSDNHPHVIRHHAHG